MKKIVLLVSLAACGGGGNGGEDVDAAVERPRVYGGDRPVELQVPTDFDETRTYPLVILLHGYSASGILQTAYLELADVPTDPGAFFMAPDGTVDDSGNKFWNASAACCGSGEQTVDDVGYIGGLIDDVMGDWPVDPTRVFLIGHSNGHFMSYRMACERADVITAIAGLAGAAYTVDGSDCDPAAPVSVLHIHGDADATVPYEGGTFEAPFPGAVASVTQWAEKDGCDPTLTAGEPLDLERTLAGAETTVETADCPAGVAAELWTIVGGSHIPNFQAGIGTTITDWLVAHPRD